MAKKTISCYFLFKVRPAVQHYVLSTHLFFPLDKSFEKSFTLMEIWSIKIRSFPLLWKSLAHQICITLSLMKVRG
jgi:hypothetical protein